MSIFIQGDGGHARVIRDLINARKRLDKTFADVEGSIIAVGNNMHRKAEALRMRDHRFILLIHPSATVASSALFGMGTVVMAGAIVQANAQIGNHVILNTNCTVDHDSIIGDFAHISPGANICGGSEVGEGAWVGANATVIQGMKVAPWSVVPAGSTVR